MPAWRDQLPADQADKARVAAAEIVAELRAKNRWVSFLLGRAAALTEGLLKCSRNF